jgi:Tol biopolymer transport system component
MHHRRLLPVLTALLLTGLQAAPALQMTAQGEKQLAAAQHKAMVDGDLKGAIAEYKKIVAGARDNRALAAQALVEMADAYQKLGDAEAGRIYAQVVREYADQTGAVSMARTRLAALRQATGPGASSPQLRLTELPVPWPAEYSELYYVVALSHDGTRIAHVDRDDDLAVYDLRTNRSTKLVRGGNTWFPVWSPDDRRIAYQRVPDAASGARSIEIVTVETGAVRATEHRGFPRSWARDGMILAVPSVTNVPASPVRLLPEAGGEARSVAVNFIPYDLPVLSPDGAYLAYSSNVDGNIDVYVAPTAGGEHVRITSEPGVDARAMWSADGAHLMFKSDRTLNRMGLWVVAMAGGRPAGRPVLVRPDVGEGEAISWSRDGKLLFTTLRSVAHLYSIDIAPPFEMRGAARQLTQAPDWNREPFVSPDGKRIVHHGSSGNNAGAAGRVLRVMGIDGSNARDVVTDLLLPYRALAGWLNDDEVVVAGARRSRAERGVYAVSTRTGAVRPIFVSDEVRGFASVSPDRSRVLFLYGTGPDARFHVIGVDGRGLTRVTSADAPDGFPPGIMPSWSPDSRWIAYVGQGRVGVVVVNVETGEQRRLVAADSLTRHGGAFWTPDGRHVVYSTRSRGAGDPASLWVVPADGSGAPVRVRSDVPGVPGRSVSGSGLFFTFYEDWQWTPDGSATVFTVSSVAGQGWIMENFLPKGSAARD